MQAVIGATLGLLVIVVSGGLTWASLQAPGLAVIIGLCILGYLVW